jgi:hypothetical protein
MSDDTPRYETMSILEIVEPEGDEVIGLALGTRDDFTQRIIPFTHSQATTFITRIVQAASTADVMCAIHEQMTEMGAGELFDILVEAREYISPPDDCPIRLGVAQLNDDGSPVVTYTIDDRLTFSWSTRVARLQAMGMLAGIAARIDLKLYRTFLQQVLDLNDKQADVVLHNLRDRIDLDIGAEAVIVPDTIPDTMTGNPDES